MDGANGKDKKGFSGLSGLASEVSGIDESMRLESKAEAKPPTPQRPPQPKREPPSSESEQNAASSPPSIETVSEGKSVDGSGGKWILGIIGVVFVIWLFSNGGQSNDKPSYNLPSPSQSNNYPMSSSVPEQQTPSVPQSPGLKYTKPSIGTSNILSVPEIRWCVRESIRIGAMRDIIDNNEGVDEFNQIVNDYNSCCGSFSYREGAFQRAESDVEEYRSQIVAEAIKDAKGIGH